MPQPDIKILQPADVPALEAFLLPRLQSSMFLLSNLRRAGIRDTGRLYEGSYAAAFDGDAIVGVVAHYWNGNLIFQAPLHREELMRAAVAASGRSIVGLVGPAEQVRTAKAALGIDDMPVQLDEIENLYSLALDALIEPEDLRLGKVHGRRIEPGDLDLVAAWRVAYSVETLGEVDTPELRLKCRGSVERALRERTMWVLETDAGTPVACTGFNAETSEAVQIGGVWTPPELRGRGYARAAVAASLLDAREEGKQLAILFTGISNIPARKAYAALGFRHTGDYRVLLLREQVAPR